MYPDHRLVYSFPDRSIRPDRRPARANEITLRIKRTLRQEA
ncbi:MAG TPA: hypothetical protein VKR79_09090 [Gaiellaceae bacterium]|nr:hypothetical protein [Gaiellaceae bacterium]